MPTPFVFNFPLSPQTYGQAVACIQSGGLIAIPTDSYYALAAGIFQPVGLEKLQAIKADRDHKPFPVLIGHLSQLNQLVDEVPEIAQKLIHQFWPGLLTLVLKAKLNISPLLLSDSGMVGIRQPHDSFVCELLQKTGPLTGTSANRSGKFPSQTAEEVMEDLGSEIDLIIDGGSTPGGPPSTVLQVEPEVQVLRQGKILWSAIQNILGKEIVSDGSGEESKERGISQ